MSRDNVFKPIQIRTSFGDGMYGTPLTQTFDMNGGMIGMPLTQSFNLNSCFANDSINFSSPLAAPSVFTVPAFTSNSGFQMQNSFGFGGMSNFGFGNFSMPAMNFNFGGFSIGNSSSKSSNSTSKIDVSGTPTMDASQVPKDWASKNGVQGMTLPNGIKILGTKFTRFNHARPEWLDMQKYMLQAAKNLGITLVYGEIQRTVASSNAGRAKKGNVVAKGGESPHNYGAAADICLFKDGKSVPVGSELHNKFAAEVKRLSGGKIGWGGDFGNGRGKFERHHFEVKNWRDKWYTGTNYKSNPYIVWSHGSDNKTRA